MRKKILGRYGNDRGHWVGDGFPVRSLFSYDTLGAHISPFLLLDYAGPHQFPPTTERRGVGQDLVHVAIRVTPDAEAGLDAAAALAAVRRIVRAFNDRLPGIEVEVESLEEAEQAEDEASDDEVDEDE